MNNLTLASSWHHTGVSVTDLAAAVGFYGENFGFEPVFEALDMSDLIQSITGIPGLRADLVQCRSSTSETLLELIHFRNIPADYRGKAPVEPGRSHVALLVPNLDKAVDQVLASGGQLIGEVTEFSEGWAVYLADPVGNVVELEEAKPDDNS